MRFKWRVSEEVGIYRHSGTIRECNYSYCSESCQNKTNNFSRSQKMKNSDILFFSGFVGDDR
ncbi:unnamed protein product, partial [Nesidiocoris tenuis]